MKKVSKKKSLNKVSKIIMRLILAGLLVSTVANNVQISNIKEKQKSEDENIELINEKIEKYEKQIQIMIDHEELQNENVGKLITLVDNMKALVENESKPVVVENVSENAEVKNYDFVSDSFIYSVQKGDTLSEIVREYYGKYSINAMKAIALVNKIRNVNELKVNQVIEIPSVEKVKVMKDNGELESVNLTNWYKKSNVIAPAKTEDVVEVEVIKETSAQKVEKVSVQEETSAQKVEEVPVQEEVPAQKVEEVPVQEEVPVSKVEEVPVQEETSAQKVEKVPVQEETSAPKEEKAPVQEEVVVTPFVNENLTEGENVEFEEVEEILPQIEKIDDTVFVNDEEISENAKPEELVDLEVKDEEIELSSSIENFDNSRYDDAYFKAFDLNLNFGNSLRNEEKVLDETVPVYEKVEDEDVNISSSTESFDNGKYDDAYFKAFDLNLNFGNSLKDEEETSKVSTPVYEGVGEDEDGLFDEEILNDYNGEIFYEESKDDTGDVIEKKVDADKDISDVIVAYASKVR